MRSVVVDFTDRFILHRGPMFNPGDRAALTPEEAAEAFRQGCAIRVQDAAGYDVKAVEAPDRNKQVRSGITK